jgi:hypothetical protein
MDLSSLLVVHRPEQLAPNVATTKLRCYHLHLRVHLFLHFKPRRSTLYVQREGEIRYFYEHRYKAEVVEGIATRTVG